MQSQTRNILDRYAYDRPAQALAKIKKAYSSAGTVKRKESLIKRLAIAERRALKSLDLFQKTAVSPAMN